MSKLRIILNGKSAAREDVREAVVRLRDEGHEISVRVTWEAGDAGRLAIEAVEETKENAIDCIVAGGGDGSLNEIFGAVYETGLPKNLSLGILPLGTANDFATSIGLDGNNPYEALKIAADGPVQKIDLGLLNDQPFINLVTGGFGSRITNETDPDLKRQLGGLAYVLTGMARLGELTACHGRFTSDDFEWEGGFYAMAIGNGRQAGGGIPLCPEALLNDGLFNLMVLPEHEGQSQMEGLSVLMNEGLSAGNDDQHVKATGRWFEYQSGSELDINLDGEPQKLSRFRIECVPQALPVRMGPTELLKP